MLPSPARSALRALEFQPFLRFCADTRHWASVSDRPLHVSTLLEILPRSQSACCAQRPRHFQPFLRFYSGCRSGIHRTCGSFQPFLRFYSPSSTSLLRRVSDLMFQPFLRFAAHAGRLAALLSFSPTFCAHGARFWGALYIHRFRRWVAPRRRSSARRAPFTRIQIYSV